MKRLQALSLRDRKRRIANIAWLGLLYVISFVAVAPLFFIFAYVIFRGWPALSWEFFTELPKPIGEVGGGVRNAIVGSLALIGLAMIIGIPWGLAAGIYLAEYQEGKTTRLLRFVTDLLTSVPSIIVGLFVYALLVLPLKGYSAYAGGAALAVIMIPVVARTTEEILKLMPQHVREAGLALGLPRWKVILRIVLPGSLGGVVTGIMLGTARIAGETAPLLFTAFSNSFGFRGMDQPTASLPVTIFNYASSHDNNWRNLAWSGALILVLFVFAMNLCTRYILSRRSAR